MRITNISVKKLFGIFDHNIALNSESGITIIIGENGLGKTVILESVHAFFTKNFAFFKRLDFESFTFQFNNGEVWEISRRAEGHTMSLYVLRWFTTKNERTKTYKFFSANIQDKSEISGRFSPGAYERALSGSLITNLEEISDPRVRRIVEYEYYQRNRYLHHLEMEEESLAKKIPSWFNDGIRRVEVKLIETQRIMTAKERGGDAYVRTVQKFSNELVEEISKLSKESAEISTSLDSTYPNRLMQKLRQGEVDSYDTLNQALTKLDERRKLLNATGLIESRSGNDVLQINSSDLSLFNPLKLYIDDSNKKLAPYDTMTEKISLFKAILNKRFKHKDVEINKTTGFVFRSRVQKNRAGNYEIIPPSKLSSGEQHELVMFYELIFNSKKGDTILIDEPELSLHISWQNQFIKDLRDVTSMNNVSVVIATHSPDIIAENWDLRVELKGVE
ncbi:AAA family ATPase [Massilia kyonggiensis]|nr:AAA family ATPase [Massilia kyonggiensis]